MILNLFTHAKCDSISDYSYSFIHWHLHVAQVEMGFVVKTKSE